MRHHRCCNNLQQLKTLLESRDSMQRELVELKEVRDAALEVAECNTRFTKGHKLSNHICARIKSHVYTIE